MGREIRRVPVDFDWPQGKVWDGFLNPHYRECPARCEGGYSATYRRVAKHLNSLMWDRAVDSDPLYARITSFLAGREASPGLLGHDSCDAYAAVKKLGELAGLPDEWHRCDICGGDGIDPAIRAAYEAWEPIDPPAGEGWQIWKTVSEGSPVSPAFDSPDGLVLWLVTEHGYSADSARAFVRNGWAPSFVVAGGVMGDGISMSV